MPFVSMMDAGARRPMRAGGKRYANSATVQHGEVVHPVTGREAIPPDQVRDKPRISVQAPGRHPGSVPMKNTAQAAAARPAADPVQRGADRHGMPVHRTEPHHKPAETEDAVTFHKGIPLNRKALARFSELLEAVGHRIADNPREVGPEIQKLKDDLVSMHLDHVEMANKQAMADRDRWAMAEASRHRQMLEEHTRSQPDGHALIAGAKATMAEYAKAHPDRAKSVQDVMAQSGVGNHRDVLHMVKWAGEKRQLPAGATHWQPNAAKTGAAGRAYGPPSSMSKASKLYPSAR